MGYGCACSFHGIAELLISKRARSYGVSLNCQEKFGQILLFFFSAKRKSRKIISWERCDCRLNGDMILKIVVWLLGRF